ncbi:MAG TPA: hypothetical protein VGQ19_11945, partial [Burkholderiales bacterium]|nr:hypothetical protein [Burkholderiales bacterium]
MSIGARFLLSLLAWSLAAQDFSRDLPWILVDVRTPPIAVRCGGRYLLQYELSISNVSSLSMTIQRLEVLGSVPLLTLEGEPLAKAFANTFKVKAVAPPDKSTVILLAIFTDRVPPSLTHRIRFQLGD